MGVLKFSVPEVFFGRESLKYASVCAKRLGAAKIFFVTDPGLEQSGWVDVIFEIFEEEKLGWVHESNVSSNPRDWQIEEGAALYLEEGCDVVVALGGGSPMDAAKGIALVASNGGRVRDYEGANRIQRALPPMIFMPSTAGSGSDISQFAIVTDVERRVKMSIISRTLVPNISIIDPILLTTKSRELIISSAIDAFAHAVESYLSPIAFPLTEIHSLKAMELIIRHLPRALESRSIDDLEQLSIAGTSAAMAFSNAGLGVDHALAHSLGGMLDVVHGLIHPVLLPQVMRYNMAVCPGKVADIGRIILGRSLATPEATARAGIEKLESYFYSLNVATRLRDIVSDGVDLAPICSMAILDSCCLSNPREVTLEGLMEICEACW